MKFQNFYTLTFNNIMSSKKYVSRLFILLMFILILSAILNISDFTLNGNDLIRKYQIDKIRDEKFKAVSTIIIGDSSAGNAIDAHYFTKLSKQNTINLSLTGSWGILGSLGMIKKSIYKNEKIKNVIIIHTLDIWKRNYSKDSILELYPIKDLYKHLNLSTVIAYYFNPKEIWWNLKYKLLNIQTNSVIDYNNDYVLQKKKKYSNNLKKIQKKLSFDNLKISNAKIKELDMLEQFCRERSLNCIFLKGPIHSTIAKNSLKYIEKIDQLFLNKPGIQYVPNVFMYNSNCIGDSVDHIEINCKRKVTSEYFQALKDSLNM